MKLEDAEQKLRDITKGARIQDFLITQLQQDKKELENGVDELKV